MVAREAVSNAVLHGRPAHIEVTLAYKTRELILCFADDGSGFETGQLEIQNNRHFGITGMRERIERWGGALGLASVIGEGTRIEVSVPRNRRQIPRKPSTRK
jgi:signal transduction histidine kinase